jgi:hypothetical protein
MISASRCAPSLTSCRSPKKVKYDQVFLKTWSGPTLFMIQQSRSNHEFSLRNFVSRRFFPGLLENILKSESSNFARVRSMVHNPPRSNGPDQIANSHFATSSLEDFRLASLQIFRSLNPRTSLVSDRRSTISHDPTVQISSHACAEC